MAMKDYAIRKTHKNDVHNLGEYFVIQRDHGGVVGKGFSTKDEAKAHIKALQPKPKPYFGQGYIEGLLNGKLKWMG